MRPLAAPPSAPLSEMRLAVPGGRFTRESSGLITIEYAGLPPLRAWPEDTPHGRDLAADTAGGDLFRANLAHELTHCVLLPGWLGLPNSPTLLAAAQRAAGLPGGWWQGWWAEEALVQACQRFAALAGVDLVKLAVEAAEGD